MRTNGIAISMMVIAIIVIGCGSVNPTTGPDQATGAGPTFTPPLVDKATYTHTPTEVPTPMVYPPVFNPDELGDNRELLDSFILTRTDSTTYSTGVDSGQETIGYIKQPFSSYELITSSVGSSLGTYLIDDRLYHKNEFQDFEVHLGLNPDEMDAYKIFADMRQGNIMLSDLVINAQFSALEEYKGIPAYHFTLDQTNLRPASDSLASFKVQQAQGDVYLAQAGNYLLYFHLKLTGHPSLLPGDTDYSQQVREMTEELSSINQLAPITLPADYSVPDLDLGTLPLPPDSTLRQLVRYSNPCTDWNFYSTLISNDAFLEFYQNLPPTDGWTVSHIGQVNNHFDCSDLVCVIIKKGDVQFVLSSQYGGIIVDFDKCNQYAPK